MPKTSLSFAQSLEKKVLPLINGAMGGWMVRALELLRAPPTLL